MITLYDEKAVESFNESVDPVHKIEWEWFSLTLWLTDLVAKVKCYHINSDTDNFWYYYSAFVSFKQLDRPSPHLLSLYWKRFPESSLKILILYSMVEKKVIEFGTTWLWVNVFWSDAGCTGQVTALEMNGNGWLSPGISELFGWVRSI